MNKKIVIPIAAVGIVIIITLGVGLTVSMHKTSDTTTASSSVVPAASSTPSPTATGSTSATATQKYKDGTYTAEGNYTSPGGSQKIKVALTVKADDITTVTVTPEGGDSESKQYESMFGSGISQIVVGKSLAASFDVSEVNGSSLTGTGFSQALQSIRTQATS